jgi:predicted permease
MHRLRGIWIRILGIFRKRADHDFSAELEAHLAMHVEDNLRAGMSPQEARRAAMIRLGGVEQVKENYRHGSGLPWMETLVQDSRFGLRTLRKNPGFTIVAIATLALGIGANTAIFSVVNAVLLRPLPFANPQNLVRIWNSYPPAFQQMALSPGDFNDFKAKSHSFSEMAAYIDVPQGFNFTGHGDPQRVQAAYATSDLFPMLGVRAVRGGFFEPSDDKPGSAPVVVISDELWQSAFHSDPTAVGETVALDGQGYTVVGVLPPGFRLAGAADVWMPVGQYNDDLSGRIHHPFTTIARLKSEVTVAQAKSEIETLNRQAAVSFPDAHKGWGIGVEKMADPAADTLRTALLVLLGAVTLVLLIACANIMNLLLARNAGRRKEIGLRIALGAGRWRLVRQLLTESTLLSLLGGLGGIALASLALSGLGSVIPANLASLKNAELSGSVLVFTTALCFLTGIVCGAIPALQTLRTDLHHVLKQGGRSSATSGGRTLRSALVVAEIALAIVPLVGAGLLIRSFQRLLDVYPGFRTDHALTMKVTLSAIPASTFNNYTQAQLNEFKRKQSLKFEAMATAIRTLAAVESVGGVDVLPLGEKITSASRFLIEGRPIPPGTARPFAETRTASLAYFSAMGIPLLQGRSLNETDWTSQTLVINESMAKRFWSGGNPIGARINLCTLAPQPCWFTIVGVVGDVHQYGLDKSESFDVYGGGGWTPYLIIRTASDPTAVARAITDQVRKLDPTLPVTEISTLDRLLADSVSPRKFSTVLLGIFAALALLLSAVGVYGVMNYVVSLQTNEIGIRMALGARPADVCNLIVGRGVKLALAGLALGLMGAFALSRYLASLLFSVRPEDPFTLCLVALILMAVALAACWIPARRAMRVDPVIAIRGE